MNRARTATEFVLMMMEMALDVAALSKDVRVRETIVRVNASVIIAHALSETTARDHWSVEIGGRVIERHLATSTTVHRAEGTARVDSGADEVNVVGARATPAAGAGVKEHKDADTTTQVGLVLIASMRVLHLDHKLCGETSTTATKDNHPLRFAFVPIVPDSTRRVITVQALVLFVFIAMA